MVQLRAVMDYDCTRLRGHLKKPKLAAHGTKNQALVRQRNAPIRNGKQHLHFKINIYASGAGESKQLVHLSLFCRNLMAALGIKKKKKRVNHEFKTHRATLPESIESEGRGHVELLRCLHDAFFQQLVSVNTRVSPSTALINAPGGWFDRAAASQSVNLAIAGLTGASEACHPPPQWYVEQ